MKTARKLLPVAALALAVLMMGCTAPLPGPQLTATAESRTGIEVASSRDGDVQVASVAPRNVVKSSSDEGRQTVLAPLEHEETPVPTATATAKPLAQPTVAPTAEPVSQPANYTADLLAGLNAARQQQGLGVLTLNTALSASAGAYAQYMAQGNFFGHFGPDGSSPTSRIVAAGFKGQYKGEALSAGQTSPSAALQALLASPAHAAILLEKTSVGVGVGYYYSPTSYYKHYWVVVTANP